MMLELYFPDACKNGMGLDPYQLHHIISYIQKKPYSRIVEFGSGGSTDVLLQARKKIPQDFSLLSFDHSEEFCFESPHEFSDFELKIKPLIQFTDSQVNDIYKGRYIYDVHSEPVSKVDYNNFKLENCFYDLKKGDLQGFYDIVILDGPNGNGRSLSAAYLKGFLNPGAIVFIDDYHHYDFIDNFNKLFKFIVVEEVRKTDFHHLHGYCVLEIL